MAYLVKEGIVSEGVPAYEHVTVADIIGLNVLGDSLPYCLACTTMSYTEIPLHLPRELVGKKLIMADYEKYADDSVVYTVRRMPRVVKSVRDTLPFKPWILEVS